MTQPVRRSITRSGQLLAVHVAADSEERLRLLADSIAATPRDRLTAYINPPPVGDQYVDELRPGDRASIVAMTTTWQGAEQAALAAYWVDRRPAAFRVFRAASGEPSGYAACLELGDDDLGADPGADAMWRYVQKHGPPRPGEQVRAWRFFLDRDHGQGSSPSVTLFAACQVFDALTRDDTAWTVVGAYADAEL
jgi:hypothetical protein